MQIEVLKNGNELSQKFAGWLMHYINVSLQTKDLFTIALSGGNTPKKLYQLLASDPYKDQIDWQKLHIFWGDERYVPHDDERNNAKMAFDVLLDHVPVPKSQIHIMRTDIDPETSASEYEKLLHNYFPLTTNDSRLKTFDLVLLGLGDNAHTLSLFPGYDIVHEKEHWVKAFFLREQEMYRISLTAPVVNLARRIAFLATGEDKAEAVKHVINGEFNPDLYPAQTIKPISGELFWFLDEWAAGELKS
jgi:6-phosphogluconolactonase